MVPAVVEIVEAFPRGRGGKVDRTALPPPPASVPMRPPTATERSVVEVFTDVLGIDGIGPDDDFFALGGDSLDAVELIEALADRFGIEISASALLDAPTPAQLARSLQARRPRTASVLVPIRTAGASVPFVCAAGGGAPALSLRALASAVDDNADARVARPFYALQARGLEERAWPDRTVEAMARRNARAIRSGLGDGPFVLGGYSFGGQVGFETAVRLVAEGVDVRGLVLIDALPAWDLPRATVRAWAQVTGARHASAEPTTRRPRPARSAAAARRFVVRKVQLATAGLVPRQGLAQYDLFLELHSASARRYRPSGRFAGPAVVIRFTGPGRVARGAPHDLGWSAWIDGPITVVELRGKHLEMLRPPDVGELGAHLRDALVAVESAAAELHLR
jgi:thioesterase domain-containing protein/acyl carrier protein